MQCNNAILKQIAAIGTSLIILAGFSGCVQNPQSSNPTHTLDKEDSIKESAIKLLDQKYGDTFNIESVERQNANMAFQKDSFILSVSSSIYPGTFTAKVDSEGQELADNYPSLFWDDQIRTRAEQILSQIDGLTTYSWAIIYPLSDQTWNSTDSLDLYLEQSETYLDMDVSAPNDLEIANNAINDLCTELNNGHFQYAVACDVGNSTVVFSEKKDSPELTEQQIYQKLERAVKE